MIFSSIEFLIFLFFTFLLYWFVLQKNLKIQNFFLLVVSYFFYGWWNWHFLSLIFISSIIDYSIGILLGKEKKRNIRKILLSVSIVVNLGFLGFFKYCNFFIESFVELVSELGFQVNIHSLKIILPVGISFYTFQTLSYTIDIYRKKISPTKNVLAFFAFVSFFPQLVAGPIERAKNLLPQFEKIRTFNKDHAIDGLRQILFGLFKKIVIADSVSVYVDAIFANQHEMSGLTLILGVFLFAFQIYGDFSGYTDIAIGTARLFGFSLMRNFAFPYFSRDIAEFWRRWHISLSSWFKDYLYFPLGGSRGGLTMKIRNTFIIFIVSGFWHGANWTFVIWGTLNAIYFLPLLLANKNRKNLDIIAINKKIPSLKEFRNMILTFMATCFAWIFFRAETVNSAFEYVRNMLFKFNNPIVELKALHISLKELAYSLLFIGLMIVVEWINRDKEHGLDIQIKSKLIRYAIYYTLTLLVLYHFNANSVRPFIYFQF